MRLGINEGGISVGVASGVATGLFSAVANLTGNELWVRANEGQTVTGAGVSTWADQSGNGRDLLQTVDTNRPALQADGSVLFDGVDNYLVRAVLAIAQPFTVYLCGYQVTWLDGSGVFDKASGANFTAIYNNGGSPNIRQFCTIDGDLNPGWALGANAVVTATFNGASSLLGVNAAAEVNGNPGATGLTGITLGARGDLGSFANVRVYELLVRSVADSAVTKALIQRYLMAKYGIA